MLVNASTGTLSNYCFRLSVRVPATFYEVLVMQLAMVGTWNVDVIVPVSITVAEGER